MSFNPFLVRSVVGYRAALKIIVVGCGGTGSHLIGSLAREIAQRENISLVLCDGDTVEEHNLIRQHFVLSDIGKNKAEVLAKRYSNAFGKEIIVKNSYLESDKDITNIVGQGNILISCVDNNATRKLIYENCIKMGREVWWIDAGNEEINGQVVCGFFPRALSSSPDLFMDNVRPFRCLFPLPCSTEIYPNLLNVEDSKFASELSCAERAVHAPQQMATNMTAATLIMNYVYDIICRREIRSHAVEFNVTNNVFNTRLNTPENLLALADNRLPSGIVRSKNKYLERRKNEK